MTTLDPEKCRKCQRRGRVINSRGAKGYRRRRHSCACGNRWTTYQSQFSPKDLVLDFDDRAIDEYERELAGEKILVTPAARLERASFYATPEWKQAKQVVIERSRGECEHCGVGRDVVRAEGKRFHIHHVIPFRFGHKRADPTNLMLLCSDCHRFIHSRANKDRLYITPGTTA